MGRGPGQETSPLTSASNPKFQYGTPEEIASRLEDGQGPTESHFNQVRPARELSPRGRSLDERRNPPVVRNGRMGSHVKGARG